MAERLGPPGLAHADVQEPVRLPESATVGSALRSVFESIRWDDRHRRLASHPLLAGCARPEVRRIVRAGDEIRVSAGEIVAQEDTIGYWFVLVLEGELARTKGGTALGTLRAGDNAGAVAILGFGPQPETIRAVEPSRLFVIGRRDFLSLAYNIPALQNRLFPGVTAADFVAHIRTLWVESDMAWRRLQRRNEQTVARSREEALRFFQAPSSGRESFSRLATRAFRSSPASQESLAPPEPPRMSRRARLAVITTTLVATVGITLSGLLLYHPPIVVVTPGTTIDVSDDILVRGASVHVPTGRYLLTPVRYDQPSLLGAAIAVIQGETTVPLDQPRTDDDTLSSARAGEARFRTAQEDAADLALQSVGLDPAQVEVEFRPRALQGTSAGLVYALALADMLDSGDMAAGRTIAVTGTLDADGRIQPVAFVWVKADAARAGGASVFLVPTGQAPLARDSGADVREVASFADALESLRQ